MKPLAVIGLGTRNRPKMLSRALDSLTRLKVPKDVEVHLVLCENGTKRSADSVLSQFEQDLPFKASYFMEENEGIVFMRNRILKEAAVLGASYLAFFDDDETVSPNWLVELYGTLITCDADVAQGHVEQIFPSVPDIDLIKRFFPGSFPAETGDELKDAYTNNVLFKFDMVKRYGLEFNSKFNLIGGSDSYFFTSLHRLGARIVFSKEALVTEEVPESRATIQWILFRYYRNGYSIHTMDRARKGAFRAAIQSLYKVAKYHLTVRKKYKPLTDEYILHEKKRMMAKGRWHAILGKEFTEYSSTHGN